MSSEKAERLNTGKPMLSFLLQFPTAIEAFSRVKEMGAIKYARDNWRKGGKPWYEYIDAAMRHMVEFIKWKMGDPEADFYAYDTGNSHLAHAMWNLMAIQDLNYPGMTYDREVFAKMAELWSQRQELGPEETNRRLDEWLQEWLARPRTKDPDKN
jgi:hypothetical protein